MSTVKLNGVNYNSADFALRGYSTVVTAGTGESLQRWQAAFVDALADAGKALTTTSTTILTVGMGSKVLTLSEERPYAVGAFVTIADTSAPTTNYMYGQVTAVSGTSLTVDVTVTAGSGTISAWTVGVSGARGAQGGNRVSANDTTDGYLNGKLVAGSGVTFTEVNDGGNETLTISASAGGGGFPDTVTPAGVHLTTSLVSVLPAVGAGQELLVYGAFIPNIDGTNDADATWTLYDSSATASYYLGDAITVPADSLLTISPYAPLLVLKTGDELRGQASAASDLDMIVVYALRDDTAEYFTVGTTATTSLVSQLPAVGASEQFNVVSAMVANRATGSHDATVQWSDSSAAATYYLAYTVSVPEASSLAILPIDAFPLQTGDEWRIAASNVSSLDFVTTYKKVAV